MRRLDWMGSVNIDVAQVRAETPGCASRIHFNNAGSSLPPAPVLEATIEHLRLEAEIGGYEAADMCADAIDGFYTATAELLGCQPENVAFATNATDAFSRALSSIPFEHSDVILTTRDDYISNQIAFLSLQKRLGVEIVHAPTLAEGGVDVDAMSRLMRERRPRVVVATHIPTNSGLVQPVAEIGRHCRELELLYLVDACQSVGQLQLDVETISCDFLSATGRKFLRAPRGTGFLYVSGRALAAGYEPLFVDMRGARWVDPDRYEPVATAARFEDWEFPYAALLGAAAATRYALAVGIETIAQRTPALGARLRDGLAEIDGVRVLDRGRERCAIVTFILAGWEPDALKAALSARHINSSVSLREYAVFDFDEKGVGWCIRLSPHYYNTDDEVDQVLAAVDELSDSGRGLRRSD
jgi:selenocysteine lyase/cysteine desulfurase